MTTMPTMSTLTTTATTDTTYRGHEAMCFARDLFAKLRTFDKDGQTWYIGKDVAQLLGYKDPSRAVIQHCDEACKMVHVQATSKKPPVTLSIIPESDVYALIMRSRLPSAVQFQKWLRRDIIPSIRKHGGYIMPIPEETPEQLMARAVEVAKETIKRGQTKLENDTNEKQEEQKEIVIVTL